jgi:GTP-binding protein LepA
LREAVLERIPPPKEYEDDIVRALIFDSQYDPYRGVINYVRIMSGYLERGSKVRLMNNGMTSEVKEVGFFTPNMTAGEKLHTGTVGYLIQNIKSASDTKMGDTITLIKNPAKEPLPGFQEIQPMMFSSFYPIDSNDYPQFKLSMSKLQLNDAALEYQAESSVALGFGFRCGFLGLLHMEIIQERLRREFNMDIIATYPSVVYKVFLSNGTMIEVDNPTHLPDPSQIEHTEEPIIEASIMIPNDYIGPVMSLIMEKRGLCTHTESVDGKHVILTASIPLHEIVIDFNDRLKSITRGYGSMNYQTAGYQTAKLVKLEILVNGDPVDAFASIVHVDNARARGKLLCERLKKIIPAHLFKVAIQAAIGGTIVARETVSAMRKDVTAKCYGGDITRKKKLLEKQKAGKKRMKEIGNVSIPQSAFIEVLKSGD